MALTQFQNQYGGEKAGQFMDKSGFSATGEIIPAPKNIPVADITMAKIPKVVEPKSSNIPIAKIGNTQALQFPQPEIPTNLADGVVAGAKQGQKTLQDYIKEQTPTEVSAVEKERSTIMDRIKQLIPGAVEGRGEAQLTAEETNKVPQLQKQLAELNSEILTRSAQYDRMFAGQEIQQGLPSSIAYGRQGAIRRTQAADIGLLQARALGLQGNLKAAQETANRSVDLMYQDREAGLEAQYKQLELIEPMLDREEKIRAEAVKRKYDDDKLALEEKKADQKANLELAFSTNTQSKYANKGGKIFRVSDGFADWTPEEFLQDAGVSSFEEAYAKGLITDIRAEDIADLDFVSALRAEYPDAGIDFTDDAQTAVDKLAGSNKYYKENYQAPETPKVETINGVSSVYNPETGLYEPIYSEGTTYDANGNAIAVNGKPLSAEASKLLANSESGLTNIEEMDRILSENGSIKIFTPNMFSQSRKQYFTQADNLVDVLGRMRSGGAITEEEETRFKGLLPKMLDDQETWRGKLNQLKTLLSDVKNNLGKGSPTTDGNQVKGMSQSIEKLPLLNMDGSEKTPNLPLIKAYPPNSVGGQCGTWVRSVVNKQGLDYPRVGNSLAEKTATVKKYGVPLNKARPGSVLITDESKANGHVAYITGITPKGFQLAESNYGLDERVDYGRVIPFNSPRIVGVINPTKKSA